MIDVTHNIRSLWGGRVGIWLATHRRDARNAALLTAAVLALLGITSWNYREILQDERTARATLEEQLAERATFGPLPRLTFVLDARDPQQLRERLAAIAGELDAERLRLFMSSNEKGAPGKGPGKPPTDRHSPAGQ